jgi:hypothetical protein
VELIEREVYNQTSLINKLYPDAKIYDIELSDLTTEDLVHLYVGVDSAIFGWLKGGKATVWNSPSVTTQVPWTEIMSGLSLKLTVGANIMKRLARLLSPRDVVVKLNAKDVTVEVIAGDEFTRDTDLFPSQDDKEALLDGMISVSPEFVKKMLRMVGRSARDLRRAEALSFTMVTPDGYIKALAYINEGQTVDIVTNMANIKSEISTLNDVVWVAFDIFMPFGNPKTNIQLDIMLDEVIGNPTMDLKYLQDTLAKDYRNIINGDAVKSLEEWNMSQLSDAIESSNKVNEDFANLADAAADFVARGGDYRWSPMLLNRFASAGSNQYYNNSKKFSQKWAKFPLPCAWARPVISESGACLIGEEIDVERGTIRAIRHGEVWVVNDQDFIEFFRTNAGGADLDDHFILMFRTINGVKSVVVGRIPMGYREFSVFSFVEGDPFPIYTSVNDKIHQFPVINKPIPKTLTECLRDGEVTITGMGKLAPVTYPEQYQPSIVKDLASELVSGDAGHVGAIINAIMVAKWTKDELLSEMKAGMETIIDTFTKGGSAEARANLSEYGQGLFDAVDTKGTELDYVVTRRLGNYKIKRATKVKGVLTEREASNVAARAKFVNDLRQFGQDFNANGNPLLTKMLKMFGMSYRDVASTPDPIFTQVRRAQTYFNTLITQYTNTNIERSKDAGLSTRREDNKLTSDQWREIYTRHLDTLKGIAGNDDPRKLELVVIINWMVCLTIKANTNDFGQGGNLSDMSVMNSIIWPIFIQATVNFGLLKNLDKVVEGGNPFISSWNVRCVQCGTKAENLTVQQYIGAINNSRVCKHCR